MTRHSTSEVPHRNGNSPGALESLPTVWGARHRSRWSRRHRRSGACRSTCELTREDKIAEGVTIGGDEVRLLMSGSAIRSTTAAKGNNGHFHDEQKLTSAPSRSTIDEAVAVSREGGLPARTWRALTVGEVDEEITTISTRRRPSITRTPQRQPTRCSPSAQEIWLSEPSRPRSRRSSRRSPRRRWRTSTRATVLVDRSNFTLTLHRDAKRRTIRRDRGRGLRRRPGKLHPHPGQASRSCLERPGLRLGRAASPAESILPVLQNPLKARWMGIYNGAGIHGTTDTASHERRLHR